MDGSTWLRSKLKVNYTEEFKTDLCLTSVCLIILAEMGRREWY